MDVTRVLTRPARLVVTLAIAVTAIGISPALAANRTVSSACHQAEHGGFYAEGDLSWDCWTDYVVGIPGYDHGAGAIEVEYRFSSKRLGLLRPGHGAVPGRSQAGAHFGSDFTVGLFNNDNYQDLAIGIPDLTVHGVRDAGGVQIMYGGAHGLTAGPLITRSTAGIPGAPQADEHFGAALCANDFDPRYRGWADGGASELGLAIGVPGASVTENGDTLAQAGAVVTVHAEDAKRRWTKLTVQTFTQGRNVDGSAVVGAHFGTTLSSADYNPIAGAPDYSTPTLHDAGFWGTLGDVGPNGQYEAHSAVGTQAGEHLGASMADGPEDPDALDTLVGAPGMTVDGHRDAGAVFDYSWDSSEADEFLGMTTLTQDSPGVPGVAATRAEFGAALAVCGKYPDPSAAIGVPGATVAGHRNAGEVITGYLPGIDGDSQGVIKYRLISQGMDGVEGIEETNAHFGESVGFAVRTLGLHHPLDADLEVGIPDARLGTSTNCGQVELFHVRGALPVPASDDLLRAPHRASGQLYGFSFQNTF